MGFTLAQEPQSEHTQGSARAVSGTLNALGLDCPWRRVLLWAASQEATFPKGHCLFPQTEAVPAEGEILHQRVPEVTGEAGVRAAPTGI